jgi:choline monooxygenase
MSELTRRTIFRHMSYVPLEVDRDPARAWTLPASSYFDPAIFHDEMSRIFSRTWQLIGHHGQVAQSGDYFTAELAGEPLLVARSVSGELNGFYNVCRHRAGPPATGCGSRKLFRCGYHGWTYDLQGKLISAPEFEGQPGFDAADFSLTPVRTEEWCNLIFASLDLPAPAIELQLSELEAQFRSFPFEKMKLLERRTYEMHCNWKTYIDNYLEGYHLPSVHPGLNRELDYGAYTVEPHSTYVRQFSPMRGARAADGITRLYSEGLTTDYFWTFPNWMLNCYPDNVQVNMICPLDAERTLAIFDWYGLPERLSNPDTRRSIEFSHQTQIEDIAICETVQKNLHSRSYQRGRYSIKQEAGVHAFHRMYAETMNSGQGVAS